MAFVIPNKKPIAPVISTIEKTQEVKPIEQSIAPTSQAVAIHAPANQLDLTIEQQLSALINKIESAIPDVRHEMITIHKVLAKDPAQVTILSTEQRAAIFAGYSKLAGIELVAKAAAKRGSKTPISIDMFE